MIAPGLRVRIQFQNFLAFEANKKNIEDWPLEAKRKGLQINLGWGGGKPD